MQRDSKPRQGLRLLLSTYTSLRPNLSTHRATIYGYTIIAWEESKLAQGLFILHVQELDGVLICDGRESVLVIFE